ncbi:DgyrCDS11302 [Dimorphilus gyrociliatus]|uniref:DgyrCDS11302 n=2 Tax=Dimorphilus gyrociliatus TaxID=2664684 RepID=A0A7I8W319_9ANNE|nr:DgyrCDS11302 [Dimorphilus gyrociliatus]
MHKTFSGELSNEDEARIAILFDKLDIDGDGRINITDLTTALHKYQGFHVPGQVQTFFDSYDKNKDGHIEFCDFVQFVIDHEKILRLSFGKLDHNRDGVLDLEEVVLAFHRLGVDISRGEAEAMIRQMDRDETLLISYAEWRDFLLLHPAKDIFDLVHYWRHASIMDLGESVSVPDDFTRGEIESGMWWRHLVAGAAAGGVSRTCTAPLDRLKVFLQVNSRMGITAGLNYMLSEGGWLSLWRGNGINVVKIAPETAIKFMAYEQIKRLLKDNNDRELRVFERFMAGSAAGAISQSAIYPLEVVKTRLALRKTGQFNGVTDCVRDIRCHGGLVSFYRGYIPNLIGIIPYAGIDLAVYETLKRLYMRKTRNQDPGIIVLLSCGMLSSTCGQLASYPLALVRTRLQSYNTDPKKTRTLTLIRSIIQEAGLKGLYGGITPNLMKVLPAVGISYVVYEHVRKLLGVKMT